MNAIGSRVFCAGAGVIAKLAAVGFAHCLIAEPEPPARPEREPGKCICGRTISLNKPFCRACALRIEGHILARRLALLAPNQEALDKILEQAGDKREEVLERIRPFLRFEPAETGSSESGTEKTPVPAAPSAAAEPESAG